MEGERETGQPLEESVVRDQPFKDERQEALQAQGAVNTEVPGWKLKLYSSSMSKAGLRRVQEASLVTPATIR